MSADGPAAKTVAIIMDGNARWATERGLPILEGHREGARTLKRTVKDAVRVGLDELTVYAFSTENWTRPRAEVEGLMAMFAELIESETPELDEQGVRMRFIGRRDEVSDDLRRAHGRRPSSRPPATAGSPSSSPSTTAAGPRSSTPPSATAGVGRRPSHRCSTRPR